MAHEEVSESSAFEKNLNRPWIKELTGGYPVIRWDSEAACKPGENFVSKVTRYFLYYAPENGPEESVTVIVKTMHPPDSIPARVLDCVSMFQNETTAYEVILPMLSLGDLVPRCYYTDIAAPLLLLEDLKPAHFRTADTKQGLNYDEISLTVQAIAYLHSRSIYLRNTSCSDWRKSCGKLRETVFRKRFQTQILGSIWENAFWTGLESLRTSEEPQLVRAAGYLDALSGQVITTLSQLSKSHDEFQVICHGDLWANNLLFRYGDDGESPEQVRMIDLQAMRPASCALDLLHLLCTSTRPGLLGQHFAAWINLYYARLWQELSTRCTPMPFTRAELYKELKRKSIFGVILGFMMIPCATSDPSVDSDITTGDQLEGDEHRRRNEFAKLGQNCHYRIRQLLSDLLSLRLFQLTSPD